MKRHALVVGGTGMLRDVSLWLVTQGYHVSVIGRNARKLNNLVNEASDPSSVFPVSVDYRDDEQLLKTMTVILHERGPVSLVVSWIHSDAPNALQIVNEQLSAQSIDYWRLFHVRGSTAYFSSTAISVPNKCLYRQVLLGFVLLENANSRWLSNKEIADGVIQAIQTDREENIIGNIKPWEKRP